MTHDAIEATTVAFDAGSQDDCGVAGRLFRDIRCPDGDTTLNVYAQVLDGSVREAAERVGSRLITIDHSAPEVATVTH